MQELLQRPKRKVHEPDPDHETFQQAQDDAQAARKSDLQSWADNILAFEKAGEWQKIEQGMEWAKRQSDREKFLYAQGVLQRRPSPQEAQDNAQQVLDAEVVTNDPA